MIEFACDSCGKRFRVTADKAGRKGNCKSCGAQLVVPSCSPEVLARPDGRMPRPTPPIVPTKPTGATVRRGAAYTEATAIQDEEIVYAAKLSWAIWLLPSIVVFVALATLLIMPGFAVGCMLPLAALLLIPTLLRALATEMTLTNVRLVLKTGVISRRTSEMQIHKIENIQLEQSIVDRIFDSGKLTVIGSGATKIVFKDVSSPEAFRKALLGISAHH